MIGRRSYVSGVIDNFYNINYTIGNYCCIARGLKLIGSTHLSVINKNSVSSFPFEEIGMNYPTKPTPKDIVIGNDVWIGADVSILEGVTIGDGAIIGMCSVITKDIPPYTIVVGNNEIKKYRFYGEIRLKLLEIKWWNWDEILIKERIEDFTDVNKFVEEYGKE